jgi:hypothetical protein
MRGLAGDRQSDAFVTACVVEKLTGVADSGGVGNQKYCSPIYSMGEQVGCAASENYGV